MYDFLRKEFLGLLYFNHFVKDRLEHLSNYIYYTEV